MRRVLTVPLNEAMKIEPVDTQAGSSKKKWALFEPTILLIRPKPIPMRKWKKLRVRINYHRDILLLIECGDSYEVRLI
ncbi:MAG: hypothetical protein GY820_29620 [Gammaproteobacteria bacterium]|nr:hypothetical protein [Gammaproteobacteria bacterium]